MEKKNEKSLFGNKNNGQQLSVHPTFEHASSTGIEELQWPKAEGDEIQLYYSSLANKEYPTIQVEVDGKKVCTNYSTHRTKEDAKAAGHNISVAEFFHAFPDANSVGVTKEEPDFSKGKKLANGCPNAEDSGHKRDTLQESGLNVFF